MLSPSRSPLAIALSLGWLLVACGSGGSPQNPSLDVSELSPSLEPVTCDPLLSLFPVNAAHNTGFDWDSCPTGTYCNLYCPPESLTVSNSDYHEGIDIFGSRGDPVIAAQDGVINTSFTNTYGGNVVYVRDDCGWNHYYAHLDSITPGLQLGQRVTAGAQIGTVGNSGNAAGTQTHVHYGVYDENWVPTNPFQRLYDAEPTACSSQQTPPPQVTGLSPDGWATVTTPVTMSWNAAAGATSYEIYTLYWTGTEWLYHGTYTTSSTSLTFSPSHNDTYYAWNVKGINTAGTGAQSDWAYFYAAAPTLPAQPTGLSPDGWVNAGSSSVTLSWNVVAGATSYEVYLLYWTGSAWAYYYTYDPGTNSQVFWPAVHNTYYAWNVRGINGVGTGPQSDWAYFYFQ